MTPKQITLLLLQSLGPLDSEWEQTSGHTTEVSFMIIRLAGIKKGHLRRLHSLVEDVLAEELGEGDRE